LTLHYTRDVNGNVTGLGTDTYSYDSLGRLTSVKDASGKVIESYSYTKTGDRLSKIGSGLATGDYGYQANTHWLTRTGNAARTYDNTGNTTASSKAGGTLGFGYDHLNRLSVVQRDQQTIATYVYNAFGQRIGKITPSEGLRYHYDEASRLLIEYGGETDKDYLWLDDLPVAVIDTPVTDSSPSTVNYVHADGLNTPRAIANEAGQTIWTWNANGNPFGEQQPTSNTGYVYNLRFPGQYFDAETGFNYNAFRYFDPSTGRYTQVDPIGFAGGQASLYIYANNNPLDYVDALGLRVDTDLCAGLNAQGCLQMRQLAPPHVGEVMGGTLFGIGSVIQGNARLLAQGAARSGLLGQDAMVRIAQQDRAVATFMQAVATNPDLRTSVREGINAGVDYAIKRYGSDPYVISHFAGRMIFGARTGLGWTAGIGDFYHYLDCGYSIMKSMQLAVPGGM
jgi:RHS repeat-associated protein